MIAENRIAVERHQIPALCVLLSPSLTTLTEEMDFSVTLLATVDSLECFAVAVG